MHLLLINPLNPTISVTKVSESRWNKYRIWKPLGLLVLAGMTPPEWDVTLIDENLGMRDYDTLPKPDLVGITAFTSQASRAYMIASDFKTKGIPVVMGGIHATMCSEEASGYADSIVTGEAESVWEQLLADVKNKTLKKIYKGEHLDLNRMPIARHDLLPIGYQFGSIQTSRGCPLNCSFCSVTAFNGGKYRVRPIDDIIKELKTIKEKYVLFVDDNLIGTKKKHIEHSKELLRRIIRENIKKKWCTQVTINMADDEEFLKLASRSGCFGVFIGFESITEEGLKEVNKIFNLARIDKYCDAVCRIQKYGIIVTGSFIMGLDVDGKGIGKQIADAALGYGVDFINLMYMTPLPGTRLWNNMEKENRIAANNFPDDWKYYTLISPVAKYKNLSWEDMIRENHECNSIFYSYTNIIKRIVKNLILFRRPLITMIGNLSYRNNAITNFYEKFKDMDMSRGSLQ